MMSDNDYGPDVYGDAVNGGGWPDMDAPHPFPDGNSASGFGRSSTSKFTGTYVERPDLLTGLSGQPEEPRYP
jgi:hypothetical protein